MTPIQGPTPLSGPDPIPPRVNSAPPVRQVDRGDPQDQVTISDMARLKAKLAAVPEIREELVNAVRAEIEAGTYDTLEKVQLAAEKLLAELKEDGVL